MNKKGVTVPRTRTKTRSTHTGGKEFEVHFEVRSESRTKFASEQLLKAGFYFTWGAIGAVWVLWAVTTLLKFLVERLS